MFTSNLTFYLGTEVVMHMSYSAYSVTQEAKEVPFAHLSLNMKKLILQVRYIENDHHYVGCVHCEERAARGQTVQGEGTGGKQQQ